MPGPMSAPNGDRSLVAPPRVCVVHFDKHIEVCTKKFADEDAKCEGVTKREYLLSRNRLRTGKTA